MSDVIKNSAQIIYNNGTNTVETCEVTTNIDKTLETHKRAYTVDDTVIEETGGTPDGIVGQDRKITNEIELLNFSSTDFTDVVITDHIYVTDDNGDPVSIGTEQEVENYIKANNNLGPNDTVVVNEVTDNTTGEFLGYEVVITLKDPLTKEDDRKVRYEIQLPDTVPVGSMVTGSADVNYKENPNKDTENNPIPEKTENLEVQLTYTNTTIDAIKQVQDENGNNIDSALCGQPFNYVLTFENTGDVVASVDTIVDSLQEDFVVQEHVENVAGVDVTTHPGISVKIQGEATTKVENTDYTISRGTVIDGKKDLIITNVKGAAANIDIQSGETLIVTINGYIPCE